MKKKDKVRRPLCHPSFSLITPNFNGASHLEETLESVFQQDYPNLEYFVIDGASSDGSMGIIERYADRLTQVVSEPDQGHADALRKGFALTSGDIMGWINSDDILLPGALGTVANLFGKFPEIEWITGTPSSLSESGERRLHLTRNWSRLRFLCGNYRWVQQESTFWRRSLWERAGGKVSDSLDLATDFELWVRFFRHAELHSVDLPLAAFRYRSDQRSRQFKDQYEAEALSVIQAELGRLEPTYKKLYSVLLPEFVRPLSDSEIVDMGRALAVADPEIIELSAIDQRSPVAFDVDQAISRFDRRQSQVLQGDDIDEFRNCHAGERCFLLGDLSRIDGSELGCLQDEIVIHGIDIVRDIHKLTSAPEYVICFDSGALLSAASGLDGLLARTPSITSFFPVDIERALHTKNQSIPTRTIIPTGPGRYFVGGDGSDFKLPSLAQRSEVADLQMGTRQSIVALQVQLAVFMGFRTIFLIGLSDALKSNDGLPEWVETINRSQDLELVLIETENGRGPALNEALRDLMSKANPSKNTKPEAIGRAIKRHDVRAPLGVATEAAPLAGDRWYSEGAHNLERISPELFQVARALRRFGGRLFGRR